MEKDMKGTKMEMCTWDNSIKEKHMDKAIIRGKAHSKSMMENGSEE
jgi:hypothetical protein